MIVVLTTRSQGGLVFTRTALGANGANGIGNQILFQAENDAGSVANSATIGAQLSYAAAGLEQGTLLFNTASAGTFGERMRIDYLGRVGIGTSSPYAKLSVWGAGTGTNQLINFSNSASTTLFTVLENGNVGIGTTNPQDFGATYKTLEVSGASGSYLLLKRTDATAGTIELAFDGAVGYLSTKTNNPLIVRTNDVERMRIDTSGNLNLGAVGAGTIILSHRLGFTTAQTHIEFANANGAIGSITTSGSATLTSFTSAVGVIDRVHS